MTRDIVKLNELLNKYDKHEVEMEIPRYKYNEDTNLKDTIREIHESDNMCEWRKIKGNSCSFETSCNNISGMYRGFNFCPYCGKKIKVVE